ncbi:MAG: hypothetical protein AAGG47_09200, partial [Pseudomonadota bacterium]
MILSRRFVLRGTACAAALGLASADRLALAGIKIEVDAESKALLLRMIRVAFPHAQFPDAPYERTADAAREGAKASPAKSLMFAEGMHDLAEAGFAEMDDAAALAHLKSIEGTAFFQHVRGTVIVTLYNDPEVWALLGYEGASYDKGGYINRGFN